MQEWPPNYVEVFWGLYPRRLDKKKAMAKLEIIRKSGVPFSDIINGVEGYARYVQGTDAQFIKHPTTWLNGECWSNDYPAAPRSTESAFVTGVANVAARYGVTAGMGGGTIAASLEGTYTIGAGASGSGYIGGGTASRTKLIEPPPDRK